jgi:transposase
VAKDPRALGEIAKLDGCYVLKTDLAREAASKETVHERYKDLALVEWAFRESKTVHLEMRPIYVRRESRTRGHAFVVMLAYVRHWFRLILMK